MRQQTRGNTSGKGGNTPKIDPPKPPAYYEFNDLSEDITAKPFWLKGDPKKRHPADYEDPALAGAIDYTSPGQIAVLVGPLDIASYAGFRQKYGEVIDRAIDKAHYMFEQLNYAVAPENAPADWDPEKAWAADEEGNIITPKGALYGSLVEHMAHIVAYIMSAGGRIVADLGDGEYETVPMTAEQVLLHIRPSSMLRRTNGFHEGSELMWYKILELSHVWVSNRVKDRLEADGEDLGELKN